MTIRRQNRSGLRSFLIATVFTGVLAISAALVLGTQPVQTAPAKNAVAKKCGDGKLITTMAFFHKSKQSNGIPPPPPPISMKDWWKVQPKDPLDFRALRSSIFPGLSFEGDCPDSDSCAGSCGGSLYCSTSGTFMQAISGCEMRCCWCNNPGSCSQMVNCDPSEN